ncbi:two pore domain potassium channel family protein [bacterium]|nr:MAG: two pore domain potassium channel family protein [bacterium]
MVALAFAWLVLLVLDLVYGLSRVGQFASDAIWVSFVVEFVIKLAIAPNKPRFVAKNWLTILSLLLPALRILRPLRLLRVARGARLLRVVGSLNRGMRALGRTMGRRGFGYVVLLSVLVVVGGAAGMYAVEQDAPGGGFSSYGDALWWSAMTLTTLGGSYAPATTEGRTLTLLLALYAFSVFGYVTATLASFFVERDAGSPAAQTVGKEDVDRILGELRALRSERDEAASQVDKPVLERPEGTRKKDLSS